MVLLFVIIFLIVTILYVYISKYNMKEEYKIRDIANNTITRIRGNYIDITCNEETVRIVKEDGNKWYYKKADEKRELDYESVFQVDDREFELFRTEKRNGIYILIPLSITMLTILALFLQTYTLLNESKDLEKSEIENDNIDITMEIPVDFETTTTENGVSDQRKNEDDLQVSDNNEEKEVAYSIKDNSIDWESFQSSEKERRNLLNNPSEIGIQISKYQGDIEWDKVKADGIDYAIIQAGSRGYEMGGLNVDPYFKKNIDEAKANGIKVGVSFHSQAINREEIDEEIELIMNSIEGYNLDYPIGITLLREENFRTSALTFDEYIDLIKYFCSCIEQRGYASMIMGEADWFDQFSEGKIFDGYYKMVYDPNDPPSDINNCIIWIYNAHAEKMVDGIKDNLEVAISVSAYVGENER